MDTINGRIWLIRENFCGGSNKEFAKAMGKKVTVVNNWVREGYSVGRGVAHEISAVFGVNVGWLLTGDGEMLRDDGNTAHSDHGGISVAGTGNVVANGRDALALGRRERKGDACLSCDRLTTENQRLRAQIEKLTNDNMKLIERVNMLTDKLLEKM